ncbi:VIT domain-containing protein [Herbidospora mongoliensis]|uniref:VIT domain-containing protein n=1 Tax=Herbidospora mongoliensis TaxID=688067 RepID=UPI0008334380|nr:VIT domain-containing protein [Herbidospora mongoliensis]
MTVPITPIRPDEILPVPDAGFGALETEKGNLPLESVDVRAAIAALSAEVKVVQGFRNPHDVALEATYVFPLPPRAAVTAFRMEADGHVVEGVLQERGEARAAYTRALQEGRRAAIAEEDRPDVFAIRVGNIVPGERVIVHLDLSQPLPYEDGAAEFRFPLVVAPRYIPGAPLDGAPVGAGTEADTDAVPDASRITPPVLLPGFPSRVRLGLSATLDPAGLEITEIQSSLHDVDREGDTLTVRPGERLDRDFILRFRYAASTSLTLTPDAEGEEGTFALTVLPPEVEQRRRPRDVVLLLDRSGSMSGWKMVAARRAAARIVDTLTTDDRFAVISFDHTVEQPFPGLAEATDRTRYRAIEHLARLEARGGTEMLQPLESALALLTDAGRDRVLVMVTDGQVGNEDQIIERVGARLTGDVRVHTVGIDRAVNAGFLGRLALLGGGRCELVESEDRLDTAMEHIHRRIGAPLVTDLTLHAEGLTITGDSVTHVGSLFPGVPLTAHGRYRAASEKASISVRGQAATPWSETVTARESANPAARAIWARAELRRLEDRYTIGENTLEKRIVETSLAFGVLCRFTAFVAIDARVVGDGPPLHQVIQPVETPSGWDSPVHLTAAGGATPMMAQAAFGFAAPPPPAGAPMAPPMSAPMAPPMPAPGSAPESMPRSMPAPKVAGRLRKAFGGGGQADRMMPHPGREQAPQTDMSGIVPLLQGELTRLAEAKGRPDDERRRYLADLASRLKVAAHMVGGHQELSALASELEWAERPDFDLARMWAKTEKLLGGLTGDVQKPFWKR